MSARARSALVWAAVVTVLGLVFVAYLRPEMMVRVADFVWSCF